MRDRLIEMITESMYVEIISDTETVINVPEIADYLLDNGVVVPLYPYGTKIYFISYGENDEHGYHYVDSSIYSKQWLGVERELFITPEEAEAKLEELKNE